MQGPAANWGIVLAALYDMGKPAESISRNMTMVLAVYSGLFMRFAWMVKPRNYLLLSCHASNEVAQLYQLSRRLQWEWSDEGKAAAAAKEALASGAGAPAAPAAKGSGANSSKSETLK
jgi:hypothetical protein